VKMPVECRKVYLHLIFVGFLPTVILTHRLLSITTPIASASRHSSYHQQHRARNPLHLHVLHPYVMLCIPAKYSINAIPVIAEVVICRWKIYGCRVVKLNGPHTDPIVILGIIIPVITNKFYLDSFQHILQPLECLLRCLLELLEFGSRTSLSRAGSLGRLSSMR
jgi:hypothetical protein